MNYLPIICIPEELMEGSDSTANEVRQARREIKQECDNDFRKIYERAAEIQKQDAVKRANFRPKPPTTKQTLTLTMT